MPGSRAMRHPLDAGGLSPPRDEWPQGTRGSVVLAVWHARPSWYWPRGTQGQVGTGPVARKDISTGLACRRARFFLALSATRPERPPAPDGTKPPAFPSLSGASTCGKAQG